MLPLEHSVVAVVLSSTHLHYDSFLPIPCSRWHCMTNWSIIPHTPGRYICGGFGGQYRNSWFAGIQTGRIIWCQRIGSVDDPFHSCMGYLSFVGKVPVLWRDPRIRCRRNPPSFHPRSRSFFWQHTNDTTVQISSRALVLVGDRVETVVVGRSCHKNERRCWHCDGDCCGTVRRWIDGGQIQDDDSDSGDLIGRQVILANRARALVVAHRPPLAFCFSSDTAEQKTTDNNNGGSADRPNEPNSRSFLFYFRCSHFMIQSYGLCIVWVSSKASSCLLLDVPRRLQLAGILFHLVCFENHSPLLWDRQDAMFRKGALLFQFLLLDYVTILG